MTEYSAPLGAPIWFDLMSSDPDKAQDFYGELFGWEAEAPNPDFGGYRNFRLNGNRVAGMGPVMSPEGASDVWTIYLRTDDPDATVKAVEAAGGSIMVPPMDVGEEGTMMVAFDSAGAVVGFWKSDKHRGFAEWGVHGAPYWFECSSQDFPASVAFYTEVVGARADMVLDNSSVEVVEPGNPLRYSQLFFGDTAYGGIMDATNLFPAEMPSFWQVYICVDDVAASTVTAERLGGSVMMPPTDTPYGTLATIVDPFGAAISLGHPPAGM